MLKTTSFALAILMGTIFLAPSPAAAIDNGPCHKCVMEPIVIKGDRKKTRSAQASAMSAMQATSQAQAKLRRR